MLNIMFKDLKSQTFYVEIEDTLTVKHLKERLQDLKGPDYVADKQVLIYAGKVLRDESIISSLEINTEKFIVVMKQKAVCKTGIAPSTSQTNELVDNKDSGDCVKMKQDEKKSKETERKKTKGPKTKHDRKRTHASTVSAAGAATASADLQQQLSAATQEAMQAISSNADFMRIRAMVERDPAKLNILVEHIARCNPELLEIITRNKESFLELLGAGNNNNNNAPNANGKVDRRLQTVRTGTSNVQVQTGSGMDSRSVPQLRGGSDEPSPSSRITLPGHTLTASESEAIERLKSMGFDERLVVQAYFACEKDENAAANFLIQQHED